MTFREYYALKYPQYNGDYALQGDDILEADFYDRLFETFEQYINWKTAEEDYLRRTD